jgi:Cu+-exporting ATPase
MSTEMHDTAQVERATSIQTSPSKATTELATELLTLDVDGMTCASCVFRVEKALKKLPGVEAVSVNLATEKASIRYAPLAQENQEQYTKRAIEMVEKSGYQATVHLETDHSQAAKKMGFLSPQSPWPVILSACLSLPLAAPMLLMPFGIHAMLPGIWQLLLALPVQVIFGARFYVAAYKALRAGAGNMDLLVAIGTSAAFGLSLYGLFKGHHELYFEASAVVITFVLLGKWLEARAKYQTTEAIRALQAMWPEFARIELSNQSEGQQTIQKEVPLSQVVVGDHVVVLPGERIPVDAIVLEGHGVVDESMLSGEGMPVDKKEGSKVTGGSMNGESRLLLQVLSVGVESTLAKMIRLVENAQAQKAPIQKLVDQVSAWFVPIVVLVGLITLVATWWFTQDIELAIIRSVSVLVIACPCALGLATPAAMMVGTGVAAKYGILIKDAQMLEVTHRLQTIVFDKTGTLTLGQPKLLHLRAIHSQENQSEDDAQRLVLALAGALQSGSEHPLAKAILREQQETAHLQQGESLRASDIQAIPGVGLSGKLENGPYQGQTLKLVSHRYFSERHPNDSEKNEQINVWLSEGNTVSWLLDMKDQALGVFAFGDQIKPSAIPALKTLQKMGIKTVMLSGDHPQAAQAIGAQLGISQVQAGMLPEDKAQWLMQYKQAHADQAIAMVGDGVNDAPALAAADVGMAMASGTDVAMHAAGVTLMRGDLMLIVYAIDLSKKTWRKIQQNLFWAFIFNTVGIPMAAFGLLTPVLAGAAMAFSSVTVLANALLLKRWKP